MMAAATLDPVSIWCRPVVAGSSGSPASEARTPAAVGQARAPLTAG